MKNIYSQTPKAVRFAFLAVFVIAVLAVVYALSLNSKVYNLENPNAVTQAEIQQTVASVGRFIVLPTDETPTLATVSDPAKLKDQPFFANALSGDKVLIYTNARKAVLWRPSIQKIIEVSPLIIPATTGVSATASTGK